MESTRRNQCEGISKDSTFGSCMCICGCQIESSGSGGGCKCDDSLGRIGGDECARVVKAMEVEEKCILPLVKMIVKWVLVFIWFERWVVVKLLILHLLWCSRLASTLSLLLCL
ncbi:hypothetical protein Droror1_Dr00006816 [Drosera rotundifolia]